MAALLLVVLASCGQNDKNIGTADWPAPQDPEIAERPALIRTQGRYFSWGMPQGWQASESTNGVTLISADGKRQAAYCLVLGNPGQITPTEFLMSSLVPSLGLQELSVTESREVPGQMQGTTADEMEFTYTDPQVGPRHGGATIAIASGYGQYAAFFSLYSSTPENWDQDRLWLPVLARGVVIINPREVAGADTIIQPRNNPLDNSGLLASWKARGLSDDRISQNQREGMMGYERLKSPTTGQIYELPFETYDGTQGGYHNPDRPEEILQRAPVGE